MDAGAHSDFATYLFDRQLLTADLATKVRETAANERIPLGRLLLDSGAMTMRDIMRVLALQGDTPGLRFGEIAMREGMINTTQLETALQRQATARNHQIHVVRDLNLMTSFELATLTLDYVKFLELRAAEEPIEQKVA